MRIYLMLALLAISLVVEKSAFAYDYEVPIAVTETAKRIQNIIGTNKDKLSVRASSIAGLYEAMMGTEVVYISRDGRHFMMGSIYETNTRRNLTEERRNKLRIAAINAIDERDMVVFAPSEKSKYTINVFTDVNCGYCSRFHNDVPELNKAGVKVRYLAFPRAGIGSETYKTMQSVWCAENQQQAMTDAKARRDVKPAKCNNPIAQQYELGKRVGVAGTPTLILPDGELVGGYLPAKRLISYLKEKSSPFSRR